MTTYKSYICCLDNFNYRLCKMASIFLIQSYNKYKYGFLPLLQYNLGGIYMKKKVVGWGACLMVLFCTIGVTVYAASGLTPYYPVTQEKTLWCWAACSEMMGSSYNSGSSPTQSEICYEIYGNTNNQACAGQYDFEDAIEFATDINIRIYTPYRGYSNMKDYIDDDEAFVMSTYSHAIFIFGYYTSSSSDERLYKIDPANGYPVLTTYASATSNVLKSFHKY